MAMIFRGEDTYLSSVARQSYRGTSQPLPYLFTRPQNNFVATQPYLAMPIVDPNTPNVDARYVQNLTINIIYQTGPTFNAPSPQTQVSNPIGGGGSMSDPVNIPSAEEVAAANGS